MIKSFEDVQKFSKEGFEAYLESYPRGRYVSLAKANIARLTASESPPCT